MAAKTQKKAERYSISKATGERVAGAEDYGHQMRKLKAARGRAQDQVCQVCDGAWKVDQNLNRWKLIPGTPDDQLRVAPAPGKTEHTGPVYAADANLYRVECPRCTAENAGRAYLGHEVNKGTGKPRGKKAAPVSAAAKRRATKKVAEEVQENASLAAMLDTTPATPPRRRTRKAAAK